MYSKNQQHLHVQYILHKTSTRTCTCMLAQARFKSYPTWPIRASYELLVCAMRLLEFCGLLQRQLHGLALRLVLENLRDRPVVAMVAHHPRPRRAVVAQQPAHVVALWRQVRETETKTNSPRGGRVAERREKQITHYTVSQARYSNTPCV